MRWTRDVLAGAAAGAGSPAAAAVGFDMAAVSSRGVRRAYHDSPGNPGPDLGRAGRRPVVLGGASGLWTWAGIVPIIAGAGPRGVATARTHGTSGGRSGAPRSRKGHARKGDAS